MNRAAALLLIVSAATIPVSAPLSAKDSLGVYSSWAAFRDDAPARCYAIAKPQRASDSAPFASVANWPTQNIRGQLHVRLSRESREGSSVRLAIGSERFDLLANGHNAWARGTQMDAAIIAALRSATRMSVSASDQSGRRFTDRYDLAGAATAIDAATVGCAQRS